VSGDRVRIYNQMTEVRQVRALAELVADKTGAEIAYLENPRNEAETNELEVENTGLLGLGLTPTRLRDELMREVIEVARRYIDRCDRSKIEARSRWVRKPAGPIVRPKVADGAR